MKLIWCSDIHLNFLSKQLDKRNKFYQLLKEADGEAILITGDIAESECVVKYITEIMEYTKKSVYFVLGNHDFYGSNVKSVIKSVKHLGYIPYAPIELNKTTILLGVNGWGDCRYGNYDGTQNSMGALTMSDWIYIDDLRKGYGKGTKELKKCLQKLADADARKIKRDILKAIDKGYKTILIASHVPPFEEVCLNAGRKSGEDGLPFFSSKCLGNTILKIAEQYKNIDFFWFSGHTHSRAKFKPLDNLTVKVAKAEYYWPQIEEIINVE